MTSWIVYVIGILLKMGVKLIDFPSDHGNKMYSRLLSWLYLSLKMHIILPMHRPT